MIPAKSPEKLIVLRGKGKIKSGELHQPGQPTAALAGKHGGSGLGVDAHGLTQEKSIHVDMSSRR
jgi:hypothetical protein